MQEDLFNWYKQGFEALPQESPPPLVWENVTAVLDGKAPRKKRIALWWWSGLSILLVVLSFFAFHLSPDLVGGKPVAAKLPDHRTSTSANLQTGAAIASSEKAREQHPRILLGENKNAQKIQDSETVKPTPATINTTSAKSELTNQSIPVQSAPTSRVDASETAGDADFTAANASVPPVQSESAAVPTSAQENPSDLEVSIQELATLPAQRFPESLPELTVGETTAFPFGVYPLKNKSPNPLWYFGLATEANNNWLFNHELRDALRKSSTNSLRPHFSSTWSLMAAHQIHPGKTLRAEILLAKQEGQHYLTYTEGLIQQKTIHLNYSGATVLYDQSSLRTKVLFGYPIRTHWLIGTSLCFLSSSKLAIGQEEINPQGYRKLNVSLVGGFEKEVLFSHRLSLASGFRLYGGLTNIFKGYSNIPSWFNRTHSGNIAFTVSLRYYLDLKPRN